MLFPAETDVEDVVATRNQEQEMTPPRIADTWKLENLFRLCLGGDHTSPATKVPRYVDSYRGVSPDLQPLSWLLPVCYFTSVIRPVFTYLLSVPVAIIRYR